MEELRVNEDEAFEKIKKYFLQNHSVTANQNSGKKIFTLIN